MANPLAMGTPHNPHNLVAYNRPMADKIGALLGNKWQEPPEIKVLKDYVRQHFQTEVGVTVSQRGITINAPSSALAASLRMHTYQLRQLIGEDKKLVIRIGR